MYRVSAIPFSIPVIFFTEIKTIEKFIEAQKTSNSYTILSKNSGAQKL
jgi:hypothetical protein